MKYVEKAIFEKLKDLAGGRVYMLMAPQNSPTPFIIVQRTDSQRWRSINNPAGIAQATMQIDVYDIDLYTAKEVGLQIEQTLDGLREVVYYGDNSPQDSVSIAGISLQTEFDTLDQTAEPLLFRNAADYLVTYHQE